MTKIPIDQAETIEITDYKYGSKAVVKSSNTMLRAHWSKWTKAKKGLIIPIQNEMRINKIQPAKKGSKYLLIITSNRKRLLDEDNLAGSHKWMIDALRSERCRFIWDDDPKHMHLITDQRQITKKTGGELKTIISRIDFDLIK